MENEKVNLYVEKIVNQELFWLLENNCLVLRNIDKNNHPTRKPILLTPHEFTVLDHPDLRETLLQCSCDEGKNEHELISKAPVCFSSTQRLNNFKANREKEYCFHIQAALHPSFFIERNITFHQLLCENKEPISATEGPVAILSIVPRLVAVHDDLTWGILGSFGIQNSLVCCLSVCKHEKKKCSHMKRYIEDCDRRELDPELCTASSEEPLLSVESSVKIPFFPLPRKRLASGLDRWPSEIRPEKELYHGTCHCEKQNRWCFEEKVGTARIFTPSTIITQTIEDDILKNIDVFVGRTRNCKCTLSCDGQAMTLINVDNHNFVSYAALTLFHSILGHGSPSSYLFANMLISTYSWSSTVETLSSTQTQRIIRPGEAHCPDHYLSGFLHSQLRFPMATGQTATKASISFLKANK